MQKLDVKAFTLSWAISFGLYFLCLGWVAAYGWGVKIVDVFSSLYIGFAPGFVGGIIGGVWAFFDWGIGALIIAIIYNALIRGKTP